MPSMPRPYSSYKASTSASLAALASSSSTATLDRERTRSWMLWRSTCCQCVNVASSTSPNSSLAAIASVGSASCSWVPISAPRRRTHGIRSSRQFHTRPSAPPRLRARAISGQGPVEVEPVEGLGGDDHVEPVVADGQLLGVRLERADVGQVAPQPVQHRRVGVGGHHAVAEGHQLLG